MSDEVHWANLVLVRPRLAMKVTVTGHHEHDLKHARDLLRGGFGEPDKRNDDWIESSYSGVDWSWMSMTVVHRSNATHITFQTTGVLVGEEELLDAHCARLSYRKTCSLVEHEQTQWRVTLANGKRCQS
jgi:hypothetical protein